MVYQWHAASRFTEKKASAQAVGERLEVIRIKHEAITPALVVQDAKQKKSPLHGLFEWNDARAAQFYRMEQAEHVIMAVVSVRDERPDSAPMRAFVALDRRGGGYTSLQVALADDALRAQLVQQAFRDLAAWRKKYDELKELVDLFGVVDTVLQKQQEPAA